MSFIYLASPYTHASSAKMYFRFRAVADQIVRMTRNGETVYSPIVAWHELARESGLPHDWQWWQHYNEAFINVCSFVRVLCLPGWEQSQGVDHEIRYAGQIGKLVEHYWPEGDDKGWQMISQQLSVDW